MSVRDLLGHVLNHLRRHLVRTCLTTMGVVIGVGALVLMISLGIGVEHHVTKLFDTDFMIKTLTVSRQGDGRGGGLAIMHMDVNMEPMRDEDIDQIKMMKEVESVSPNLNLKIHIAFSDIPEQSYMLSVLAIPESETQAELRKYLIAGDLWQASTERLIVLPSRFATRLNRSPESLIGMECVMHKMFEDRMAHQENLTFRVSAVYDSDRMGMSGGSVWLSSSNATVVRSETKGGNFPIVWDEKRAQYLNVFVKAKRVSDVDIIKVNLRKKGYEVHSSGDAMQSIQVVFLIIESFLACLGGVGLLIALFGITNTMAMAVLERTREIGIMKAIGATAGLVQKLFLIESAMIGLIGGMVGIGVGWSLGKLLNVMAISFLDLPSGIELFEVSTRLFWGTLIFSIVISALAGFFPARRAAHVDPIKALRYE